MQDLSHRHPSTQEVMQWFDHSHLASPMRNVSEASQELAEEMVNLLPDSPELTVGLRKLLEAKDCFVRAVIAKERQ